MTKYRVTQKETNQTFWTPCQAIRKSKETWKVVLRSSELANLNNPVLYTFWFMKGEDWDHLFVVYNWTYPLLFSAYNEKINWIDFNSWRENISFIPNEQMTYWLVCSKPTTNSTTCAVGPPPVVARAKMQKSHNTDQRMEDVKSRWWFCKFKKTDLDFPHGFAGGCRCGRTTSSKA